MSEQTTTKDPRRWVFQMWDLQPVLVPLYALLLAFIVGGVLIALIGVNPFEAYWALLRGMFGSAERIAGSIARSVPFIGSALALAFAFRAGLFNIGAEGQLLIGGVTAAWVGTWAFMYDLPGLLAIPIIIFAGFVGGAFWGGIPGVLRARTGAHEVISTIMLNSIALFTTRWLINSTDPLILRDTAASVPRTTRTSPSSWKARSWPWQKPRPNQASASDDASTCGTAHRSRRITIWSRRPGTRCSPS